ncbi:MAG: hypothetical protein H0T89_05335 [Deltaproteobacteria bacterium]|nr:hypothetical protein [Deltaproteobacteria bacterium]MDQ3299974.1 hypothetical protein [Myxococcota bacterium]
MRLGTCIALELAMAASAVGGVWFGVDRAAGLAGHYLVTPEAEAATHFAPRRLPRSELQVTYAAPRSIFGASDDELLAPLGEAKVTRIKLNRGGTSLSLRLDFANGTRAAFKPEQTFPQSDPRREIAAYRIDRLLGIGHVPPAKPTAIPLADLIAAAEPQHRTYVIERLGDAIVRGGTVYGELSWWVPEIKLAKLGKVSVDEREGRDLWTSLLQVGAQIPVEWRPLVEQLATVVVFDVLIDNADRWSGANTVMSPDGKLLYFMDNTLSFSRYRFGHEIPNNAMRRIQVFPRRLIKRLRGLTEETLVGLLDMGEDTRLGALLSADEIRAILARRDNILVHVDRLIAEFGEDAVLALP